MNTSAPLRKQLFQRGFSLIEIAVVLVILTVLLSGIAIPLSTQVEGRRLDESRKQLEEYKLALLGFVSANDRFPCPAKADSNGLESFCPAATGTCVAGATTTYQSHGNCSNFYDGFLPAVTLGLNPVDAAGLSRDAWGSEMNRIRYAVRDLTLTLGTDGVDAAKVFTAPSMMKTATMAKILRHASGTTERDLLSVCIDGAGVTGSDCGTAGNRLVNQAPAVIFSLGPNAASTNGTSTHESRNTDGNVVFVSRDRESGTGEFDDVVTWISIYKVFDRMIAVGKLP